MFNEKITKFIISLGFLILIIGLVIFSCNENLFQYDSLIKADKVGQLGDFIGGIVGSIWALAGVLLFYIALIKQKEALEDQKIATQTTIQSVNKQSKSLELQIEELKLQRSELKETRKVFKEQEITLKIQQFETSFFNLLTLFNNIINSIDLHEEKSYISKQGQSTGSGFILRQNSPGELQKYNVTYKGRDCLKKIFSYLSEKLNANCKDEVTKEEILVIENQFGVIYNEFEGDLLPYYNILHQLLKLVDRSSIDDKEYYIDLIKTQLTSTELILIGYYLLASVERPGFLDLIKKYSFFDSEASNHFEFLSHYDLLMEYLD